MKKLVGLLSLSLASIVFTSSLAVAKGGATGVGNGGQGIGCRNDDGSFAFELMDLDYANTIMGRDIFDDLNLASLESTRSLTEMIDFYESTFAANGWLNDQLRSSILFARRQANELLLLRDSFTTSDGAEILKPFKPNCRRIQLATALSGYFGQSVIVNEDAWKGWGSGRRALLLIHEGLRSYFGEGPVATRAIEQVVGFLSLGSAKQVRLHELMRAVIDNRRPVTDDALKITGSL